MSRITREQGQASAEYLGVIIAAALLVAVLVASNFGPRIAGGIDSAICSVVSGDCDEPESSDPEAPQPVDPHLTQDELNDLMSDDPQDAQDVLASLSPEELAWLQQNAPDAYEAAMDAQSWAEQRALVEQYANGSLDDFEDYKHADDHDGRLDYTDDGCSAPVVGSTGISFDFTEACERHDFGYRNYKRLGLFDEEKHNVDSQFLQDMLDHCATRSVFLRGQCRRWAYVFYAGVAGLGGHCDPPGPVPSLPGPCAPEHG